MELSGCRELTVVDLSGQQEYRAFEQRLARCGWRAHRLSADDSLDIAGLELDSPDHFSLLYVGCSVNEAQRNWLKSYRPTLHLLVSDAPGVLSWPESRHVSANILAAPYSDDVLRQQLQLVAAQTCSEQEMVGLLAFNLIGESDCMQALLRRVARIAHFEAPVLIQGETGTGKEIVARSIHYASQRESGPFVSVNCGAMTDELLLSELFGHAKGAFTDARERRKGLVNEARTGTLFLDEVDALSGKAQRALLRFLQENEFRAVGSDELESGDVRIVCASNRSLKPLFEQGVFREDLYYRLHVLDIHVPPLRDRAEDIPLLTEHFLAQFSAEYQQETKVLHPDSLAWMRSHAWPGNVRQLENFLHRAFVNHPGPMLCIPQCEIIGSEESEPSPKDLPFLPSGNFQDAKKKLLRYFEREYLQRVLAATSGNVTQAARLAGQDRRVLTRMLKKHGIERRQFL